MVPWRSLLLFLGVSVGTTTAIPLLSSLKGWNVHSPAWIVLAPVAMWAPALGRLAACRTVDRGFRSTLPLSRWGATGAQVILWPLAVPLVVYSVAYTIGWRAGFAHWSPGGGRWTTGSQIAVNLLVNLFILGAFGTFTALGEEIGWRGYLQPRLDTAGVRGSVVIVSLCELAYHVPLIAGAGYVNAGSLWTSIVLFTAGGVPWAFILAHESYRARSVWPAVFFHSFHNTISQWLFPRFFAGGDNELWLGEAGLLPLAGYVALGAALFIGMRRRGQSWSALATPALTRSTEESKSALPAAQP
jgi:membrane protease YdiL (CAAX protease family)